MFPSIRNNKGIHIGPLIFTGERQRVASFALIVMIIATIPYYLGFTNESESWRYSGFVFGVEDGNSYIAKMLRGSEGDWLFRTPYTAEEQDGAFAFFSYLLLGKLASSPAVHEQLVVLFHLYRIAAGMLAILASYDFIALFVDNRRLRFIGLFFISFGGGLGYLLLILGENWWLGNLPLEFYSPESFGFLTLLGLPHLGIARALLLWGLVNYLKTDMKRGGSVAGILWLLMGIFQPLLIVQVLSIIVGHLLFIFGSQAWQKLKNRSKDLEILRTWITRAFWAGCIPLPLALYTYIAFSTDPVVKKWTAQNIIHSPHPLHYLVAYGLVLPFAIVGVLNLVRSGNPQKWLLPVWFALFPALVYVPYNLQRRLAEGFWVVLVVLALVAVGKSRSRMSKAGLFVGILTLPSTVVLFVGSLSAVSHPDLPLYRPSNEVAAFQYLAENASGRTVVLSSYETGNALPAWVPAFVLIGHGPESADLATLQPRVREFFQKDTLDSHRIQLLREYRVNFVFWGPMEKSLGDWDPAESVYLELVYEQLGYGIYQVSDIDN